MKVIRYLSDEGKHLGLLVDDEVLDLTSMDELAFNSFIDLTVQAHGSGSDLKEYVSEALKNYSGSSNRISYDDLDKPLECGGGLLAPLDPPEIWGCGVTYRRSREAREFETGTKGVYDLVYDAERPEIFFKATADRCVGPNGVICVRGDSDWTVPEAELAFILGPDQSVVGFTAGNDVSARDIEGGNPLYLPQAKIYRGCCSLGPSIVTVDEVGKEPKLKVECEIFRDGESLFKGSINTSQMKRSIEELRSYLCRYNPLPTCTVCLTGTGIVPPDDFSLREGDVVEITIEKIGKLGNIVKQL